MTNADDQVRGYRVRGRVQGVGFRWWTRTTAQRLGLVGVVWNRADGSVEVHAAGPRDRLDLLAERLGEGPAGASVEEVASVEAPDETSRRSGFEIGKAPR